MAIFISKPKSRETYHLILAGVFILLVLIFFFLVFKRGLGTISIKPTPLTPPQINFSNLDNPLLDKLDPYPKPEEFTGILGREMPFLPTSTSTPTSSTTTLPF